MPTPVPDRMPDDTDLVVGQSAVVLIDRRGEELRLRIRIEAIAECPDAAKSDHRQRPLVFRLPPQVDDVAPCAARRAAQLRRDAQIVQPERACDLEVVATEERVLVGDFEDLDLQLAPHRGIDRKGAGTRYGQRLEP